MRARVVQVFALEIDLRAARHLGPALGVVDGRRTSDEMLQLVTEFFEELRVGTVARVGILQLGQRMRERFGNEGAAVGAEVAARVGKRVVGGVEQCGGCAGRGGVVIHGDFLWQ